MDDHLIELFVERLAGTRLEGPVINQYAANGDNEIRRRNLRLYLGHMAAVRPAFLLVGEAPGHRGCRLTGVPFTSEAIILDDGIWPFGARAGYRRVAGDAGIIKEATATMVWSSLAGLSPPPLLWNAFPFHPHQPGRPDSNRRPFARELETGAAVLSELLAMFPVRVVAAVGRCAAVALEAVGAGPVHLLRHPSYGGKKAFQAGLSEIGLGPG